MMIENEYFTLLKDWCDRLLELQITEIKEPEFFGGLLCPACGGIHGRSENAIYPLTAMADYTGDDKYVVAADRLFDWTEHNMLRCDGSFYNDANSSWKGITVFSSQGLAEALLYHAQVLDEKTKAKWTTRLRRQAEYTCTFLETAEIDPVVNYIIGVPSALALAGKVLNEPKYTVLAKERAAEVMQYINDDNLIFGEGKPIHSKSAKGCGPIDIGYNVEESLPSLVNYAFLADDKELIERLQELLLTHLEFMLPDGGWDNSFGTRTAKWSYWGSRTSDGCQLAYCRMAKFNPVFAEAAHRNFLMYKQCTHNGLLYGGPMYHEAGQPPCVHHTFCHAKVLAHMVDVGFTYFAPAILPRDTEKGIVYFPSFHVSLLSKGPWRATISDYDFPVNSDNYSSGGTMTMLWNKITGPVLAASMPNYYLTEPNNMQHPKVYDCLCQTPRIEYKKDGILYSNLYDREATVTCQSGASVLAVVFGNLKSKQGGGEYRFSAEYALTDDGVTFSVLTDAPNAVFHLPVISRNEEKVDCSVGSAVITGQDHRISIDCNGKLEVMDIATARNFNPVGGFLTVPLYVGLTKNEKTVITLSVN